MSHSGISIIYDLIEPVAIFVRKVVTQLGNTPQRDTLISLYHLIIYCVQVYWGAKSHAIEWLMYC